MLQIHPPLSIWRSIATAEKDLTLFRATAIPPPFAVSYFNFILKYHLDYRFLFLFRFKATATPFRMLYRTNRDETMTSPTADALIGQIPANGNRGFCLNFKV